MHPLHDYVAKQLAGKLKSHRVVVWYDERGEFQSFVEEVRGGPRSESDPVPVDVKGTKARLAEYAGSMFELRAVVEPHVSSDTPGAIIIYMPNVVRDHHASVLMELEKAGTTWEPHLKQLAKNVLLQKYTLGVVDEMLPFDRAVSYEDVAHAAAGDPGAEPPSILKSIFHDSSGNDALLATWLVSNARDAEIVSKEAIRELMKLVKARLGLELQTDAPLTKLRAITLRYVLAGEFRLDLSCDAPASLDSVPKPTSLDEESAVRELARRLRTGFPDAYAALADRVEEELGLKNATLPPGGLGTVSTFRFEERTMLRHAGDLISNNRFSEALELVADREQSFWLDRDVSRKAQWEATRRMADLGDVAVEVRKAVSKTSGDASVWLDSYVSKDGWFRLDQAQRRLEAWVANLDEEPEERPLGIVRRAYEDACHAMAEGFTSALARAGWTVPGALNQTRIWSEVVAERPKPVAYFMIDAMRFEMGVELAERLPKTSEVSVRAAVGALPSITPIGMAALQPGASASFSLVEQGGKLGARIDDSFLPDLASRKKHSAARVPKLVDLALDELLSLQPSKLMKKLDGAQVVVVRSQEIDHAGETGFTFQARQVMDTVIDNLARAIRKLAAAGIEHSVVTADHGHLFFANDRDESMRTDAPGGDTVELHRRCWIGRGGATPPGSVRVSASSLGYASDLELVFPAASGVFKAGGDLAFHHGGPSLQEVVIPVLTVRTKVRELALPSAGPIEATGVPEAVTNRIFSVTIIYGAKQMLLGATGIQVRPLLMAAGKQVGAVGMAVDAQFDRATGTVDLEPNKPVTIAFLLSDESAASLRIVVQDPTTDAELYRTPTDIPVRLGV
ncbi:PglZ domain-containing protein [Burkholderia sp. Bp8986]|uniref:PglZ domain-containing protein n=1 Tax=Burkholderia sp. Bp8986 TaxID=2184550 RepID=UPI000F5A1DC4|nr:PglZ domain-containing protein [Burkholderia sp. Bp8986]RQS53464.1 PglZ domain-containing protein [Burkholderia sp. Bp8986]